MGGEAGRGGLRGLGRRRFGCGRMPGMGVSEAVRVSDEMSVTRDAFGREAVRIIIGGCIICGRGSFGDGIRGDGTCCEGGFEEDGFRLNYSS